MATRCHQCWNEEKLMKLFRSIAPVAMLCVALVAEAHVGLVSSTPKDKSQGVAPKVVELRFTEDAYLVSVTLQGATGPATPLTIPYAGATTVFPVALPALAPGDYVVSWRVESDDDHATSGKLTFKVIGEKP
jgi:methionine-rich copper-binding protein CopC